MNGLVLFTILAFVLVTIDARLNVPSLRVSRDTSQLVSEISEFATEDKICISHASSQALFESGCDVALVLSHTPTMKDLQDRVVKRVLVVSGTKDGINTPMKFAAARHRAECPDVRFFFSKGASHGSFLNEGIKVVNDLEALVTSSHTRGHVAELVRDFTLGKIGKHVQETDKIADPLVKALELEGSQALGGIWCNSDYPTNAQCNYPKYPDFSLPGGPAPAPYVSLTCAFISSSLTQTTHRSPLPPSNCICGSKWVTDYASPLIATDMQSFHVHTSDAFHDVSDEHPFHLPHIWNECEVPNEDCTLNVTSLTMLVEGSTDFFPNATSALELRAKLKSRQTLWEASGLGKQDADKTDKKNYTICRSINQMALDWALENAESDVVAEYKRSGEPLVMVDDKEAPIGITGPQWIKDELVFNRVQVGDNQTQVEVQSWKFDVGKFPVTTKYLPSGMHYCKLLSPARAMEWIYTDSHRHSL